MAKANQLTNSLLKNSPTQTRQEELVNALIHGLGIVLSLTALILFWQKNLIHVQSWQRITGIIFACSATFMYVTSVLYHTCNNLILKHQFRLFDHLSIYYLIAGSYTPFALITLHGFWGWCILTAIWSLALLGSIFKIIFINQFEKVSLAIYLLMGWLALLFIKPLWDTLSLSGFLWLVAGGICYTIGTFFYYKDQIYYYHAAWHGFVLAGTSCHFFSIFFYVLN